MRRHPLQAGLGLPAALWMIVQRSEQLQATPGSPCGRPRLSTVTAAQHAGRATCTAIGGPATLSQAIGGSPAPDLGPRRRLGAVTGFGALAAHRRLSRLIFTPYSTAQQLVIGCGPLEAGERRHRRRRLPPVATAALAPWLPGSLAAGARAHSRRLQFDAASHTPRTASTPAG